VQALIRENEALKARLAAVEVDFANRLNLLERVMLTRRERVSVRKKNPETNHKP